MRTDHDSTPASSASRGIWLDKLPEGVCENIAAHVCHGAQNGDALHLIRSSPSQREAVISILNRTLAFRDLDRSLKEFHEWWSSIVGDVWKQGDGGREHSNDGQNVSSVNLGYPTPVLHAIHVKDRPEHLYAIRSVSIRKVTIEVCGYSPVTTLLETLSSINAEELALKFPYAPLAFNASLVVLAETNALAAIPSLKSLAVYCLKRCYERQSCIWAAIAKLSSLRELSMYGVNSSTSLSFRGAAADAVSFISSRQSIALQGNYWVLRLALRIGRAVTSIDNMASSTDRQQLLSLVGACPRLKRLHTNLVGGADNVLVAALKALPDLEALHLQFRIGREFTVPTQGKILEAVQVAHNLTELSLFRVRIQLCELKAIMEHVGPRLRVFNASIHGQEESPLVMLVGLCESAAKHNHGLRTFLYYSGRFRIEVEDPALVVRLANQALCMLRRLETRVPFISTQRLSDNVRVLICAWERAHAQQH